MRTFIIILSILGVIACGSEDRKEQRVVTSEELKQPFKEAIDLVECLGIKTKQIIAVKGNDDICQEGVVGNASWTTGKNNGVITICKDLSEELLLATFLHEIYHIQFNFKGHIDSEPHIMNTYALTEKFWVLNKVGLISRAFDASESKVVECLNK